MEHIAPIIHLGGIEFDLSVILMILVTSAIVLILGLMAVRNASVTNPTKMQNFLEWVIEFVVNIIGSTMDFKKGKLYLSLGLALIMYIFVGNMLGLPAAIITEHEKPASAFGQEFVTQEQLDEAHHKAEAKGTESHGVEVSWYKSPTADVAVTGALTVLVIGLTHFEGLRRNRKYYLKHYVDPYIPFLPLNLIKEVAKPLSLALRLYGNIYAGEVMIAVIKGLSWFGIPALIVWQGFSVFVGAIQAFVFVMLTMVYMSQAIIHEEHSH
ncbi:F0F1 ATP synthase subunit A [Paenibacillus aurantius]|uniref:ATP synthase subunit a n=1 Tax=Paenibacillus aurantius TaxID=2918900 RepID=A0AA96RHW4_9BACL|nr:F0F1 ATP synthase subunit A [Paenibacillus aurantius]WJH36266.1 F0F1 ATP synthase subunit A [Paenibacillus sp. CC-CFT747]WNQ11549.1 F0F1 ATP synthase subunit A [Paenibacillus aurantius]